MLLTKDFQDFPRHGFLQSGTDWMKIKNDLNMFSWAGSKMHSTNQITDFFKYLYLKNNGVSQPDIFHNNRDSRKIMVIYKVTVKNAMGQSGFHIRK